jgi:hypothetical protein
MPRRPRTHSYRLHRPSGQAVVTLDGHDTYLGRWDSPESRAEYDRLISESLVNGRGLAQPESGLTFNELMVCITRFAESYYVQEGQTTSEVEAIRVTNSELTPTMASENRTSGTRSH